uniref:Uncharacterized protein n=1 Tax=Rhizophora mucronata TaxID=61149 RepID=A0A2P2QP99_RHIMU
MGLKMKPKQEIVPIQINVTTRHKSMENISKQKTETNGIKPGRNFNRWAKIQSSLPIAFMHFLF